MKGQIRNACIPPVSGRARGTRLNHLWSLFAEAYRAETVGLGQSVRAFSLPSFLNFLIQESRSAAVNNTPRGPDLQKPIIKFRCFSQICILAKSGTSFRSSGHAWPPSMTLVAKVG